MINPKLIKYLRLKEIQDISEIYQKPVCDSQALPEPGEGDNLYHPSKMEDIM